MPFVGILIIILGNLLNIFLTVYSFIVIITALMSWINPNPYNPLVRFFYKITEPSLRPIRRVISLRLPFDISPLILLLIIYFIQNFLIVRLIEFGYKIKGGLQ
jgi:YGGT family.